MAALVASVPLPFLLDSLLASSWTWLALSLATIATLLRALSRIPFSRHRPQALLPPPSSIISVEAEQISSFTSKVSHPLRSFQKRQSNGSATPEIFLREPDGLGCPDSGFLSCMHDGHAAHSPLLKASSSSKIFTGQLSSSVRGCSSEGALRFCLGTFGCKLGLGLRLGFLVDSQKGGCDKDDINPHHFWTSDSISVCKPLQNSLLEVPPCFEEQFGWHKLSEMRLGAPWRNRNCCLLTRALTLAIHDEDIVKVWSTHQRNLFKVLMVEESSIAALDVNIRDGLACIACGNGEISLWDITNQACLSRVCSDVKSISAICWNAEKGVIAANGEFLGLWDCKSPRLIALSDGIERLINVSPYSDLQCRGDMLHISHSNDTFLSVDLRKPQGRCLSIGTDPDSLLLALKMEEEESIVLWEKLASDEEESWDEYHAGHGDMLQKSSSFTSRCARLVRSRLTTG